MPPNVVQSNQENGIPTSQTSATLAAEKDRRLWLSIRHGLFIMIQAIEERWNMPKTRATRDANDNA